MDFKWIIKSIKTVKPHTLHSLLHHKNVNFPTFYKHIFCIARVQVLMLFSFLEATILSVTAMYGKYALETKIEKRSIFTIKSGFYVLFIGTVVSPVIITV